MTSTLPPLVQALSGAVGTASANALTYPLDLVTTRIQVSKSRKTRGVEKAVNILRKIVHKHGLSALYDGLNTDTAATLLSNFFYFYVYSFLRAFVIRRANSKSSSTPASLAPSKNPLVELSLGFIAGVASRAISTPLSVITVRLQTEREDDDDALGGTAKESGVGAVIKHIYKENGLQGFWRGFETTILLSLNPSITLFFFQLIRRLVLRSKGLPSPKESFFVAAAANSAAVTILYPLILAKTRLQTYKKSQNAAPPRPVYRTSNTGPLPFNSDEKAPGPNDAGLVGAKSHPSYAQVVKDPSTSRSSIARKSSGDVTMADILRSAYEDQGIGGLYQGLSAQILKGCLSQGVGFMVKARIEQMVVSAYLKRRGMGVTK